MMDSHDVRRRPARSGEDDGGGGAGGRGGGGDGVGAGGGAEDSDGCCGGDRPVGYGWLGRWALNPAKAWQCGVADS